MPIILVLSLLLGTASAQAGAASAAPELRSASALIVDGSGKLLYGKAIDAVRPIASITKLMTAIVVLEAGLDLEEMITVTRADRDTIRGTGSRLEVGARLSRRDMLALALMASENRAANALGSSFPGGTAALVEAMNRSARRLGMSHSAFRDPAGLDAGNVASAQDLLKLVKAAYAMPLIREATTRERMTVYPYRGRGPLHYGNTNRLLRNASWDIALSKTGYINEAGRCLVMQAEVDRRELSIILLDSFGKLTPFGDSNRIRRWLAGQS